MISCGPTPCPVSHQGLFFMQGDSKSLHPQLVPLKAGNRETSSGRETIDVGIIEIMEIED